VRRLVVVAGGGDPGFLRATFCEAGVNAPGYNAHQDTNRII
jgi:hypothetical protein